MRWVKKTGVKTFSTEFFDWQIQPKKYSFSEKIVEKALFKLCKSPIWA